MSTDFTAEQKKALTNTLKAYEDVNKLTSKLPEARTKLHAQVRYALRAGVTAFELAEALGVSRSRVYQLRDQGLE